jgi:hypothetical protein
MTATAASTETAAATARIRELNEQMVDFGKKAGLQFLEGYEATVKTYAEYQDKFAESAPVEWVATAARTQANLTREITRVYATTTRDLLK